MFTGGRPRQEASLVRPLLWMSGKPDIHVAEREIVIKGTVLVQQLR